MRRTATVLVVLFLALTVHRTALGATDDEEEPADSMVSSPEHRWYGLPIIFTDVVSDVALVFVPPVGLVGMTLGAPLVHLGHRRPGMALASLGLRLAAEGLGFYLMLGQIDCEHCSSKPLAVVAPMIVAQILDASALAWNPTTRGTRTVITRSSSLSVAPTLTLSHRGGYLGIGGAF